ncbi:hypothetical protein [Burkholderia ubonensis]|uniref:hypothetical protein n=1 Tax=Burkholderia ubonensis TaxID=101571 RepID=UPI0012F897FD|nr:hypothetical protein [Burkholderia ubonensis]
MNRAVWGLLAVAIVSWGICGAYPTSDIRFGWIGTLFGSVAGLIATVSSYLTEDKVDTRGGVIFKSESPIKFLAAHASVGLILAALVFISFFGCMGQLGQ